MSYEKQDWESGNVITAGKLNHIENGIESISVTTDSDTVYIEVQSRRILGMYLDMAHTQELLVVKDSYSTYEDASADAKRVYDYFTLHTPNVVSGYSADNAENFYHEWIAINTITLIDDGSHVQLIVNWGGRDISIHDESLVDFTGGK